jgi:hypothetical protein
MHDPAANTAAPASEGLERWKIELCNEPNSMIGHPSCLKDGCEVVRITGQDNLRCFLLSCAWPAFNITKPTAQAAIQPKRRKFQRRFAKAVEIAKSVKQHGGWSCQTIMATGTTNQ